MLAELPVKSGIRSYGGLLSNDKDIQDDGGLVPVIIGG